MMFSKAWFALMRRNIIYRKRNWMGALLELILPMGFVGVLVGIKYAAENADNFLADIVGAEIPSFALTPLSFGDYITAMKAQRRCVLKPGRSGSDGVDDFVITGISNNGFNWMVPAVKCNSYECESDGQNASQLCEYGSLGLAPSAVNDAGGLQRADDFEAWLYHRHPELETGEGLPFAFNFVQRFSSPEEMDQYVTDPEYGNSGPKIVMGLVWEGNATSNYRYTLRQNSTNYNAPEAASRPATSTTPDTKRLFNDYARNDLETCIPIEDTPRLGPYGFSCTGQYVYNGVITFQRLVGDFILNHTGAAEKGYWVDDAGVHFTQFPTKPYEDAGFYATIQETGPLLVTLGLLYPVASMIGYITREKELRQKELLKMMSVQEADIGWSWFVTFFVFNFVSALFCTAMSTELYVSSDTRYLFSFWASTFLAVTVFAMMVSSLLSKASRAVLVGLLVFFIGVFLTIAIPVDYREDDGTIIGLISLHPVAAFSYGLQEIGRLEDQGIGLRSNTVGFTDSPSGYTFNDTIRYLMIDSIFWGLVTFYLNRVIRPDYGRALPLWFAFMPSYWFPSCAKAPSSDVGGGEDDDVEQDIPLEPVSDALKRQTREGKSIEVRGLCKAFGDTRAVDGLNLSMYSGQITALLGHNGAGKTTMINMLTGAMEPTEGFALLAGRDIRNQMHAIRQDIGICLQHDCLFPELTVQEHVRLFSRLKGLYSKLPYKEAEEHVKQAIRDVALYEKRNTLSKNLSGGMKRKLSVAIAFCGGSKLIFLDEPTSGMDPFARRFTWNIIRQYRKDRCIILTTHFMDEADILGDRIAIMAEGQLRCVGSSLFLKKHYGVGYQLTIEKRKEREVNDKGFLEMNGRDRVGKVVSEDSEEGGTLYPVLSKDFARKGPNASGLEVVEGSDEALIAIVQSAVSAATLLSNVGSELSFQLPVGAASDFQPMFEGLDREIEAGGITSYGVSITTLDEVFILVARGDTAEKKHLSASTRQLEFNGIDGQGGSVRSRMDLEKDGMFFRHLGALFKKRAAFFRRDKKAWLCTTVLPSIFVCLGFVIFRLAAPDRNLASVTLDLNDYNINIESGARNPIVVNEQGSNFDCQPGTCSYFPATIREESTNEVYDFCGTRSSLVGSFSCSINESRSIIETLTGDAGAEAQATQVEDVRSSSLSLNQTRNLYAASRYGAILFNHESSSVVQDGSTYREKAQEACATRSGNYTTETTCDYYGGFGYVIQYNYTALHVTPLYQALADEALVRHANVSSEEEFNIHVTIAPLPITTVEEGFGKAQDAFSAWFLLVLSFSFISGAFASFIVTERQTKARHLQTVSGVSPASYWFSTYLWDILNYQIPLWIAVMLMFAFDVRVMTTNEREVFSGVLTILILYGPASAGFTYCITYAFVSASLCNMFVIIFNFLIGMGGPIACFILLLLSLEPGDEKPHLARAADIVTWICRFTPSFCLGKGLFNAINIDVYAYLEGDIELSAWSEPVLLYEVFFLVGQSVVYIGFAILLDIWSTNPRALALWQRFLSLVTFSWLLKLRSKEERDITVALPEDEDVINEQDRVLGGGANDDLIVLSELSKIYDTGKIAVNNMSLGIPPGECFGLLGINGAGKTTAMGMLTAEFPPTHGDATLAGFSVSMEPQKTRRRIGYCPQFDAHFANLTGREHVELYAAVKGVPRKYVKDAAASKLAEVGLSEYDSDRLSAGYSGGMKRRLSLACATIGQPQIVFLDECSTGVDPVARREIWQLISDMVEGGNLPREERTSIILTTHSMEECEALCPRIGIMATGRLRCLGSAQHLKNKFGQGYQIELKVRLVGREDEDLQSNLAVLAKTKKTGSVPKDEEQETAIGTATGNDEEAPFDFNGEEILFNLEEVLVSLRALTGDDSISGLVEEDNPTGYSIWKDASSSTGVALEVLAAFATSELRMKQLEVFVSENYSDYVLRERQDSKARYEVGSEGIRISSIFASIEANKEDLRLADYGVSQTSLEQVFNMHAAEAERLKQYSNDG